MRFFIILTLFAVAAIAVPVEQVGENKETQESPLTLVDLETESSDDSQSNLERQKRQFGGKFN